MATPPTKKPSPKKIVISDPQISEKFSSQWEFDIQNILLTLAGFAKA